MIKNNGTDGAFFIKLIRKDEHHSFLASPQMVRLLAPESRGTNSFRLSSIASLGYPARWRKHDHLQEIDFISYDLVDKHLGILSIERIPSQTRLPLTMLPTGSIAFGRIRPYLANIGVIPETKSGFVVTNSEWIVIQHKKGLNHLLCSLLRADACLSQLHATSGQTRPRISIESLAEIQIPWPFDDHKAKALDSELKEATTLRTDADARIERINREILAILGKGK